MTHQSRGLIDNQQLAIFVNDLEEMLHGGRIIV
jgi:hypothetical protein